MVAWNRSLSTVAHSGKEKDRTHALDAMQTDCRDRQHAFMILRGWDHQLQLLGLNGLASFQCKTVVPSKLRPGQKRSLQEFSGQFPYPVGKSVKRQRYVLESEGKKQWELVEFRNGQRPVLTITADQGGSNLPAALFAMQHLKLRMLFLPDPHHRGWNDWKNAMSEQGAWGCVLDSVVCCNLQHGPWMEASWHHKLQEAFVAYFESATHTDSSGQQTKIPP